MKCFLAVAFNMGFVRKNEFTDYWSAKAWRLHGSFSVIFSERFYMPRDDSSYRPSVRLGPLLYYMNNTCMFYISSGQVVAINKSLVAGKVHNPLRQYLSSKCLTRFGTKVWLIADSNTTFVLQCYVYEGARYDSSSKASQDMM